MCSSGARVSDHEGRSRKGNYIREDRLRSKQNQMDSSLIRAGPFHRRLTESPPLKSTDNQECGKGRKPDPCRFAGEDTNGVRGEEFADANRGDGNRSNREEIATGIKRGEEGHT